MRRASLRVVPGPVAAVGELCLFLVPAAQFNQGVNPLVQVPATYVGPHVAYLLLASSPDFLDVVEVFLDRPTCGNCFQDVADFGHGVCAEVGRPAIVLKANDDHANLAADQLGGCQKRLILTRHLDAAAMIRDGGPTLAVPGTLGQTDFVLAIDAVDAAAFER